MDSSYLLSYLWLVCLRLAIWFLSPSSVWLDSSYLLSFLWLACGYRLPLSDWRVPHLPVITIRRLWTTTHTQLIHSPFIIIQENQRQVFFDSGCLPGKSRLIFLIRRKTWQVERHRILKQTVVEGLGFTTLDHSRSYKNLYWFLNLQDVPLMNYHNFHFATWFRPWTNEL